MTATNGQCWDPVRYAKNARFVSDLGAPVIELLAPQGGERILDIGCGDGALTRKLVDLGCRVVAIDSSPEMIEHAQSAGLDARVMDAQSLDFESDFDAVFSNAALHWMKHVDAVIDGVWRALKPGGRFVGEFGGQGNTATIVNALVTALQSRGLDWDSLNPWYYPSEPEYRARLESRGFVVNHIALISRPTPLPGDLRSWLETFARTLLAPLSVSERPAFLSEVTEACKSKLMDDGGDWTVDYVRLRFAASKPISAI